MGNIVFFAINNFGESHSLTILLKKKLIDCQLLSIRVKKNALLTLTGGDGRPR